MADKVEVIITGRDELSGVLGGISGALGGLGRIGLGIATAGIAAVGAGIVGLGVALNQSVQDAMESQNALSQLNAVIESTSGIAGVTAEMADNLATSLQKVTRFSDETILGGENLLLTFTKIGKDIFPEATETMLNMAQALGEDVHGAAIQLGKALQDPVLGITALRRVGVSFNSESKDIIKTMVEQGNILGAQKYILAELEVEFGNAAQAAGKTFAGQIDILNNRFSDMRENLGLKVIPILETLMSKVVMPLIPSIEALVGRFGDLLTRVADSKGFQDFLDNAMSGLSRFIDTLDRLVTGDISIPMAISQMFDITGFTLPDLGAALIQWFSGIDWAAIGQTVAQFLGGLVFKAANWVSQIDWEGIRTSIVQAMFDARLNIAQFLLDIDWEKFSQDLAAAISGVDWNAVGQAIHDGFAFMLNALQFNAEVWGAMLRNFVTEMDWGAIAGAINNAFWDMLFGLFNTSGEEFGRLIGDTIRNAIARNPILNLGLQVDQSLFGSIPGFAAGGVVPGGFPNDSFLARLTSGEQIIPAGQGGSQTFFINLQYSPVLSTASKADVERLLPMIEEGARRALRNLGVKR